MATRVHPADARSPKTVMPKSATATRGRPTTSPSTPTLRRLFASCLPPRLPPRLTISPGSSVGKGGRATVVRGSLGARPVAVKVLPRKDPQSANELAAFASLGSGHANVVSTLAPAASPDGKHAYLPMELCEEDLLAFTDRLDGLEENDACQLFRGVVAGLRFLHARGVCHLDLKPENIMLRDGVPKIIDLGTAALGACGAVVTSVGTPIYGSPEAIDTMHRRKACVSPTSSPAASLRAVASSVSMEREDGGAGLVGYAPAPADVWALGVTLFVLVTGYFPWKLAHGQDKRFVAWTASYKEPSPATHADVFHRVFGRATSQHLTPLTPAFMDLIRKMLHPDPRHRITIHGVASHPFFVY